MKYLLVLILLVTNELSSAQQITQVVELYPNSKYVKKAYYVLRSDKKTRQGDYYEFQSGSWGITKKEFKKIDLKSDFVALKIRGYHDNGLKDSLWTFYDTPNQTHCCKLLSLGKYDNGNKAGIWKTYSKTDPIITRYDFTSNTKLDPIVTISPSYPDQARRNNVQGIVTIKFILDNNCNIIKSVIIKDIGFGCAQSAINSFQERIKIKLKYGIDCNQTELIYNFDFKLG